jgi:hypothetical protein
MMARAASAVPVRPRPPRQATSTRSPACARRCAACRASSASARSVGIQKSGQRIHRCGQAGSGPSAKSRAKSAGLTASLIRRPRTRGPVGSVTSPASSSQESLITGLPGSADSSSWPNTPSSPACSPAYSPLGNVRLGGSLPVPDFPWTLPAISSRDKPTHPGYSPDAHADSVQPGHGASGGPQGRAGRRVRAWLPLGSGRPPRSAAAATARRSPAAGPASAGHPVRTGD